MTGRYRALAITGPTASGKTAVSLEVARRLDTEIISLDSRQVYRGMDIGTAKASAPERARVPHHGLDLVDPRERYSAGRFARDARGWIDGIEGRGRVPLLVGGTGFFLRALTDPIFRQPRLDQARLRALRDAMARWPREKLAAWVRVLDPARAEVAVAGGPQRMGRTLEIALLTGRPLSWWHREAPAEAPPVRTLIGVLEVPRDTLDVRIEARTRRMVEEGLVEEVRSLLERGVTRDAPGMTGVGYREIVRYLDGEWTADEAVEAIARSTRRYARRQMTWFRNQLPGPDVVWLDGTAPVDDVADRFVDAWVRATEGGGG